MCDQLMTRPIGSNPCRYHGLTNELFSRLLSEGKITERIHPEYPNLRLYKYAAGYNFFEDDPDTHWVEMCRGLVWDWDRHKVVANPMPKFHNHFNYSEEELRAMFNEYDYEVHLKSDGSCVLLWHYDGDWHWSTLGSFESEQAKMANKLFCKNPFAARMRIQNQLLIDHTYIFEAIYPENRIVLDYGDASALIYLTCRHNVTGSEILRNSLKCNINIGPPFRLDKDLPSLLLSVKNEVELEGAVVKFYSTGPTRNLVTRVKFKTDWYFKHSRLKQYYQSNSEKLINYLLQHEKGEIEIPDQALHYLGLPNFKRWVYDLMPLIDIKVAGMDGMTRKDQAEKIKAMDVHPKIKSALFCYLDGKHKKAEELVWKSFVGMENDFEAAYARNRFGLYG